MKGCVLVTGAGRRLGRAVALAAAGRGWDLAVHFRDSAGGAEQLCSEARTLGVSATAIQADLADPAQAEALPAQATAAAGAPLIGLVNSAAVFEHDTIDSLTAQTFERHMRVNALAPLLLAKAFAAALPAEARGVIVNFLDYRLAQPYADQFSYGLSKYALAGGTEMLARAFAPRIRVNAVAPGFTLPAPGQTEADYARLHADNPLQRGTTADDVARAVVFLMESEAVSGQTIYVDGGLRFLTRERDFAFS